MLYKPRNVFSVMFHYGATIGIVTGSVMLAQPWAIGAAVLLAGGLGALVIKSQKKFLENNLVKHPDVHRFSPNLGKIAADLYKKSGLTVEGNPVYDFKADKKKVIADKGVLSTVYKKIFDLMGKTHNAAAMNLGTPVIMISEPLLKLLDDEEEKAVLAHEFTHAAARHNYIGLPQKMLSAVSGIANGLTLFMAALATGLAGIGSAVVAVAASGLLFRKFSAKPRGEETDIAVRVRQKKIDNVKSAVNSVATTAIFAYFSPAYLGIFAAVKGLGIGAKLLGGTFSRSKEYQADRGAVELGANPLALVTSLRKMTILQERAREKAFKGNIPQAGFLAKSWKKATATHPTWEKRIGRLSQLARKQGLSEDLIRKAANDPIKISSEHDLSYDTLKAMMKSL